MELYHQGHWLCSRLCAFSPWPSGTISSLHLPLLARPQVSRGPAISFLPFLILKLNTTSGPLPIGWEHALLQHTTTPAQNTDTGLHYLRWCQKVLKKKKNSWMWVKSMKKRCEKKLACLDLCAPGHLCLKLFLIALITVQKMPLSCCLCSQLSNSTCQVMGSTGKMLSCVQKGTNRNMWQGLLEWKQAAEDNPGDEANRPTNLELQEWNLGRMTAAPWEQAASCCPPAAFGWLEKVQARGAEDVRLSGCCLLGQCSESSVKEKAVLCLEWCVPRVCTQQWVP